MNIIAIMGPHGVFYKDEPIKELESALVAQGFQIIWPQNSVDLLKFIEHNPRICGVIFDWDEYSLDLCSDINQLNEYLPLYAFINTHSTMDVSVQDMRMALWFFEYALGQAEDIAIRMRQYTDEYLDNITPPFTKALFTYVKERKYTFCTPGHMGGKEKKKINAIKVKLPEDYYSDLLAALDAEALSGYEVRFINQVKPSEIQKLFKEIPADYLMRLLEVQAKVGEGDETLIISEELQ